MLDGQTSQLALLHDERYWSGSAAPYSVAGHAGTHVPAPSKMLGLLQSVRVLDEQTSRLVSLQDEHCRSASATPYSVAEHPETLVSATSKMQVRLRLVQVLDG